MPTPKRLRALFAALLTLLVTPPAFSENIIFLTHDVSKYTYMDEHGERRGQPNAGLRSYLVELVRELMVRTGHSPRTFREVPFPRGLDTVQHEPGHAMFNVARTPERMGTVKWVWPTYVSATYFYRRRDSDIDIRSLEDAKRVRRIGVGNGTGNHTELAAIGFTNLMPVRTQGHALKLLADGRVDLVPVGENVVNVLALRMDIALDRIERTELKFTEVVGAIAFSNSVPDAVIADWQRALDELRGSARHEHLIETYYVQ